jgi:Tfp pilus assembly protein PilO
VNAMHQLSKIVSWARTRNGLLVIVGALLLLNLGRLISGKYAEIEQGVESKQTLLSQYRLSIKDIDALRARVKQLEARKQQFESQLFHGATEKDVTSAMQIKLQEVLGQVGLQPESLSPVTRGGKDEGNPYGEVLIKIRLSGNLDGFVKFLAALDRMGSQFLLESVTVKPFKKDELKIFLELKGFYLLTEPPGSETAKKGHPKNPLQRKGDAGRKGASQP